MSRIKSVPWAHKYWIRRLPFCSESISVHGGLLDGVDLSSKYFLLRMVRPGLTKESSHTWVGVRDLLARLATLSHILLWQDVTRPPFINLGLAVLWSRTHSCCSGRAVLEVWWSIRGIWHIYIPRLQDTLHSPCMVQRRAMPPHSVCSGGSGVLSLKVPPPRIWVLLTPLVPSSAVSPTWLRSGVVRDPWWGTWNVFLRPQKGAQGPCTALSI